MFVYIADYNYLCGKINSHCQLFSIQLLLSTFFNFTIMKRKLLSILALLVAGVTGAWAETYTDETVTATWSMADGSTSVGVVSPDAAALSTSWGVGSNMTFYNTTSYFTDYKMSTFRTISSVTSVKKQEGSYVEWTFTPNPGLTFTPTNVSFNVVKAGTGDPSAYVDFIDGDGNEISLATKATIVRDNAADATGINLSYSLSDKGAVSSSNAVKLRVYTGKHANNKSVGFSDVIITGTVTGTTTSVTTYTIEAESSDISLGTVSGGNTYAANATAELSATALTGGKFVKWQIKNGEDYEDFSGNTDNPLSVTVTADASYKAIFKALYKITFAAGEGAEIGTNKNDLPATYAETTYTTPSENSYISKTGYTATGWTDGTNNYDFGEEITLTGDIELSPVFVENTKVLAESKSDVVVTWEFRRSNGGAPLNIENATGYYIVQQKVSGETQDIAIFIDNKDNSGYDGKRGKTNNVSSDKQTQVNPGSKFTIPAVQGMEVRINAANKFNTEDDNANSKYLTTIGGVDMSTYLTESQKGIVYTYTGETGTTDIIFGSGFGYLYNIVITYPGTSVSITPAAALTTYVTTKALDFTGVEGLKAYAATAAAAGTVTLTEVTAAVPAGTPLILEGTAATEYTVPVVASATALEVNLLKAGDGTSEFDGTTYDYLLAEDGKFHQISSGTIAVGKAYLHCDSDPTAAGARALTIEFGGKTTGINKVEAAVAEDAEVYNLLGQRVAQPTKGLYIVNGKKVIIK